MTKLNRSVKVLLRQVRRAVGKKNLRFLIDLITRLDKLDCENEYVRIFTLSQIEESVLWKSEQKYKDYTWPQFLHFVYPRFGNSKYQRCKHLLGIVGAKSYSMFGGERMSIVARYQPHVKAIVKKMAEFTKATGQIPSLTTVNNIGIQISKKPLRTVSAVIDTDETLRVNLEEAKKTIEEQAKEISRLKKRIIALTSENNVLKQSLRKALARKLASLVPNATGRVIRMSKARRK